MNVEFKSVISRDSKEDEVIKFTAPLNLSVRQGFKTWEFLEPSNNIMNLIEANEDKATIFAGAQTIELQLKTKVQNSYQQTGMPVPVYFESFLNEITIDDDNLELKYSLWQGGNSFGDYHMTLKVK